MIVHCLDTHNGLDSFFQLHQAEDEVLFYSKYIPYFPNRIQDAQLNPALHQTVKPGPI